ncbi:Hypothetical predicted protein [Cloeon dipterum]|uniref:BTB domain-containing protein n=1 Tax=Cloeon dipterum TaxID=197152 RepID=A0A8S1DFB5_9INSE|nr:Hypothetical predicted protein [Cloeon dipterum]
MHAISLLNYHSTFLTYKLWTGIEIREKELLEEISRRGAEVLYDLSESKIMCFDTVKKILQQPRLNVFREKAVFDCINEWRNNIAKAVEENEYGEHEFVKFDKRWKEELVPLIRFEFFTTNEVHEFLYVQSSPLGDEEKKAIVDKNPSLNIGPNTNLLYSMLSVIADDLSLRGSLNLEYLSQWRGNFIPFTERMMHLPPEDEKKRIYDAEQTLNFQPLKRDLYLLSVRLYNLQGLYHNPETQLLSFSVAVIREEVEIFHAEESLPPGERLHDQTCDTKVKQKGSLLIFSTCKKQRINKIEYGSLVRFDFFEIIFKGYSSKMQGFGCEEIQWMHESEQAMQTKQLRWLETEAYYNCTFQIGPPGKDKKLFKCHRHIIAMASPVFEVMMLGKFMEAKTGIDDPIPMFDVSPAAFEAVLRFVYGGCIRDLQSNIGFNMEVLEFAHKWKIETLERAVAQMCLKFDLTPKNLFELHYYFVRSQLSVELNWLMEQIHDRANEMLRNLKFFPEDFVKLILVQTELNIFSEKQVYDALLEWGEHALEYHERNHNNIRLKINDLLKYVRFQSLTWEELALITYENVGVLSPKEIIELQTCVPLKLPLPEEMKTEFCLDLNWRGMFEKGTEKVIRVSKLFIYGNSNDEEIANISNRSFSRGNILITDTDVYLLSIGLFSMNYANYENNQREISITLLEVCGRVISRTVYRSGEKLLVDSTGPPRIRLEKPCLLRNYKKYVLRVHDNTRNPLTTPLAAFGHKDKFGEVTVSFMGSTDVLTLELAKPF